MKNVLVMLLLAAFMTTSLNAADLLPPLKKSVEDPATGLNLQPGEVTEDTGVEMKVMNLPTPETETSTHYFYAHSRHFKVDDPEWDEIYRTQFTQVFEEDQVILNQQQMRMSSHPDAAGIDINGDAPNIQVRRLMDELIAAEQADAAGLRETA